MLHQQVRLRLGVRNPAKELLAQFARLLCDTQTKLLDGISLCDSATVTFQNPPEVMEAMPSHGY
jgi:hypothetical protein